MQCFLVLPSDNEVIRCRDYFLSKKDYLMTQVGNPEGADKPNKKQYDPRVWFVVSMYIDTKSLN